MVNLLNSVVDIFKFQKTKVKQKITPVIFKQLEYNEIQELLFKALKSIGLKPHITHHLFPSHMGKNVSVVEVYINYGCKVVCSLHNPNNSLLVIYIWGSKAKISIYKDRMNQASQQLLESYGIVLEVFQNDFEKTDSQLTINQYISPVTDIFETVRETLKPIRK
jgi:hypothetical protein